MSYEFREGDTPDEESRTYEDLTPEERAMLDALFAEPFPSRPYALVPAGGEQNTEYTDYVIHKDIETEHQCVFVFDSIVDAFQVAEEYKQATGRDAEPVECDVYSLDEERFWVRFYRANGVIATLPLTTYKEHIHPISDDDDNDDYNVGNLRDG